MQEKTIELKVGNASLFHKLTPVPSNNTHDGAAEWMCYVSRDFWGSRRIFSLVFDCSFFSST